MSRDAFVSVLALFLGLVIAWLACRPTWADAGTSLGLSVLGAGVLAARGHAPLAAALSVSTPAVIVALFLRRPETAIALPGALVGAFLGFLFRRLMRWGAPPPPAAE
jgi:hypothetical protein